MPLRFTLRDLLWLTALVALAVGWWLDHDRLERQREMERLEQLIGTTATPITGDIR
jgi:hypothetical protein